MQERLARWYQEAKGNRWYRYFTVFCRIALALGFLPSGIVKLTGERFTALPSNHPLGQYFDVLHLTGFYYTFIGVVQLVTAVLLIIPRTALLGALLYFPIIFNICILAYATRFEGTRITTFMVLASLWLLVWDYDRLKQILFPKPIVAAPSSSGKFPWVFFGSVIIALASVVVINAYMYNIRPGNSQLECTNTCPGNDSPEACSVFCDCIYNRGESLEVCLKEYERVEAK